MRARDHERPQHAKVQHPPRYSARAVRDVDDLGHDRACPLL
jgi:hypothetical protein